MLTAPIRRDLIAAAAGFLLAILVAAPAPGQSRRAGSDSAGTPRAATEVIPRDDLERMYRRELEGIYDPKDSDKVFAAHELLEAYFAFRSAAERKKAVADLEKLGLDVGLVGRLARLRMHWPALEGGGVFYVNETIGPHRVRYFLGVPRDYDRTRPWPLVIKLPGAHAFVSTPPPDGDQVAGIYTAWAEEELARHPDAILLMPLLNYDELYGPSQSGMNHVIQPMFHAAGRVNVDSARVYMVGHSMSAHAAWNLALHYPTYFAAINPLAGSATQDWQRLRLINLRNILPVIWHDANDDVIRVGVVRSLVKALRGLKLDVEYNETKGVGHVPTDEIATAAYEQMRGRSRELYPPQVWLQSNRPETMFNRADWVQAWEPVATGGERRVMFRRGGGRMKLYKNTLRVNASVPRKNHIEVTTDNVATLRLYVNDRMIDFKEPVTVVVNKKTKFEGLVKPDLEEMLKDQLFLGRGWRYFTGAIDLELTPPPPAATRPTSQPATKPARKSSFPTSP